MANCMWEKNASVQNLREYLMIPSVHPNVNYDGCVEFLKKQAASLKLPLRVYELVAKKPIVVITWQGLNPDLSTIVLNSHMDVVAVSEEYWTHPPFAAHITEDGWIYARGVQDMKSIGIMHLEAVRRLKNSGVRLNRTVHIVFSPDEETGGYDGMRTFVESKEFQDLNVGFALDESMPTEEDYIKVFYGERTTIQYKIICPGVPAHGSALCSGTAGEKLHYIIGKFMAIRAEQKELLDSGKQLGEVTTVNLTLIGGGTQANILPDCLWVVFDIRFDPEYNFDEFTKKVETWCQEAGDDVSIEYVQRNPFIRSTKINENNIFWTALTKATSDLGFAVKALICPGATDARYIRHKGIPAIGFSPLMRTPVLLHAHDERLHVDEFEKGITIFEKVIAAVANV